MKLEFKNFGPFYETVPLTVAPEDGRPLILIRALNDVLKTSFLNAFRFCLYGTAKQPIGLGKGETLHKVLVNRRAASQSDGETSVSLSLDDDGDRYVITRSVKFKKVDTWGDAPELSKWRVIITDGNGAAIVDPQNNIKKEADYDDYIEKWIPRDMQQFFLFDGEKIQTYASKEPSPAIYSAIEKILGIRQIRNLRDDLIKLRNQLTQELEDALVADETTREAAKKLVERRQVLDKNKADLEVEEVTLNNLENTVNDLANFLSAVEGLEEDWKERNEMQLNIESQKTTVVKPLLIEQIEWNDTRLLSEVIQLTMKPSTPVTGHHVRTSNEVAVLTKTMEESPSTCPICDGKIDEASRTHMSEVMGSISNKEHAIQKLLDLIDASTDSADLGAERSDINTRLSNAESEVDTMKTALKLLEDKIDASAGQKEEEVKEKHKEHREKREQLVEERALWQRECIVNEENFEQLSRDVNTLNAGSESDDAVKAQARLNKTMETLAAVKEIIDSVLQTQKISIEEDMTKIFAGNDGLTNNPGLYTGLSLDNEYRILVKQLNHPPIPAWKLATGAGMSAMIAFTFIAALNRKSAVKPPVIIDTPTGRLDPVHSSNIVEFWPKFAEQVFILYQPNELAEWQYPSIQDYVSHHYRGIRKPSEPDISVIIPFDDDWQKDMRPRR